MTGSESWNTANFTCETPQLLLKTRFDRTGYHIQLTDLSRIWGETLSKQDIINRAVENGCTFNPGDDDDNYDAFLKYIRSALNGEAETTSNLRPDGSGHLLLDLRTPLPGGLPALEWTINFAQLPDSAVATEIVNPLLFQANNMRSQIHQLIAEISAKDHVIQKITDKLEAGGSDLTAVFPSISNIKTASSRIKRSQVGNHVAGLAEFDEATWRASHVKSHGAQELTPEMMNEVLRDLPAPERIEHGDDDWTHSLTSTRNKSTNRSKEKLTTKSRSPKDALDMEQESQDDFERKETPPHLSKKSQEVQDVPIPRRDKPQPATAAHTAEPGGGSETETDDEDCLDVPPTTSQRQAVSTIESPESPEDDHDDSGLDVSLAKSGRPGDMTSKKDKGRQGLDCVEDADHPMSSPPNISSPPEPSSRAKHDTASEAEPVRSTRKTGLGKFGGTKSNHKSPVPQSQPSTQPSPQSSKPKSKLGKFGGKKAQSSKPTPEPPSSPPSASKPKTSLGKFGGKASNKVSERHEESPDTSSRRIIVKEEDDAPAGESLMDVEQAPERELTEEEKEARANEKRENLKRELEAKAKGPVKKKRKF